MSDRFLVPYDEKAIVKADRQIEIATKALLRIDSEFFIKLLIRRSLNIFHLVSSNKDWPWTTALI